MNDNRIGGLLLVTGSVAGLITMSLHPVAPHGPVSAHQLATLTLLNRAVHGLAIAGLPMMFLGAMALTRRLAGSGRFPLAALVVYGFALVAILIAACLSGFVSSDILSRIVAGDPQLEARRMMLDYTFRLNQAFASVFVVAACVAIFLWSVEITRTRRLAAGLGVYGLVLGPAILGALFSGKLSLDVHGFGLVTLLHSIWFIAAGILLLRSHAAAPSQEESAVARAFTG